MTAPAATRPAESSQALQAFIAEQAVQLLQDVWPLLDRRKMADTLPAFSAAVAAVVRQYGLAAGSAALMFYRQQRAAAGIRGIVTLQPAAPADMAHVRQVVGWATNPLWTEPDLEPAVQRLEPAVERLVLNTGRSSIIDATRQDKAARGWARVPEPGACSFCALLATRGAVYKENTAGFRAHDNCRCHVEPVFGAYEPTALTREAQRIYREIPHGSPAAVRNAFRVAWEQRAA